MFSQIRDKIDSLLGRGRYSASVPVMDGPLQPNQALEEAAMFLSSPSVDNLVSVDEILYFSSGPTLFKCGPSGNKEEEAEFESDISFLAADKFGALAVGLDGKGLVIRGGQHDGLSITKLGGSALICPTAALFLDKDTLVVASGSTDLPAREWKRDLMALGESGSVWQIDLAGSDRKLLKAGLAYPYGLTQLPSGSLVVSEAWRHRLIQIPSTADAALKVLIDDLPGYPSRILSSADGGFLLTLFAPRNQLAEFVLGERAYCKKMIETVHPAFWVAPSLTSGSSFKEVLQYGAVKRMGVSKAWAPTWSYGIVVLLGSDFQPIASWHSRADGTRHGVTSVARHQNQLLVGSKGAGQILVLNDATSSVNHA